MAGSGPQSEGTTKEEVNVKETETEVSRKQELANEVLERKEPCRGKVPEFCSGIPESQLNTNLPFVG